MPLDDRARQIVREFRAWIISAVGGELQFRAMECRDREDESTLGTRWEVDHHLWYEIAIRPFLPQVRIAILTDDPWRSRDFEQMIEGATLTVQEFVGLGFESAGLAWRDPPVEHYCEKGRHYYFATPLDLESIDQLTDQAFREKTRKVLDGYCRAFSGTTNV